MGLPIFREPLERDSSVGVSDKKNYADALAAHGRSTIRRLRSNQDTRQSATRHIDLEAESAALLDLIDAAPDSRIGFLRVPDLGRVPSRQQTRSPVSLSRPSATFAPILSDRESTRPDVSTQRVDDVDGPAHYPDRLLELSTSDNRHDMTLSAGRRPQSRRGLGRHPVLHSSLDPQHHESTPNRPSLRRVGNRSVSNASPRQHQQRPSVRATRSTAQFRSILDPQNDLAAASGLGDRDRSVSPASSDDPPHWETFLSTITPDPYLPSASTSFTSSAATESQSFPTADPSRRSLTSGLTDVRSASRHSSSQRAFYASALHNSVGARMGPTRREESVGFRPNLEDIEAYPWTGAGYSSTDRAQILRHRSREDSDSGRFDLDHYLDCPHHRDQVFHDHSTPPPGQHRQLQIQRLTAIDRDLRDLSERHQRFTAQYNAFEITEDEARRELCLMQAAFDRIVALRERLSALTTRVGSTLDLSQNLLDDNINTSASSPPSGS